MINKEEISKVFQDIQTHICQQIETADGLAIFKSDNWTREEGGGGRSNVIENGNVLEKGGVNFSAVHGPTPQKILDALGLEKSDFFATGVSIVMHPHSPHVPIIHMNIRYFEMSDGTAWFGGGIDLTPIYIDNTEANWFHEQLKLTCDQFHPEYYLKFKKWADEYFFIKHRNETRGVGGIFFDRLTDDNYGTLEEKWRFVQAIGHLFPKIYTKIIERKKDLKFTEEEKEWQLIRRGRYAEFNLVWDKGTKFGLDTNGRTESILMSMPPITKWVYNYQVLPNSPEEHTLNALKKGINWIEA